MQLSQSTILCTAVLALVLSCGGGPEDLFGSGGAAGNAGSAGTGAARGGRSSMSSGGTLGAGAGGGAGKTGAGGLVGGGGSAFGGSSNGGVVGVGGSAGGTTGGALTTGGSAGAGGSGGNDPVLQSGSQIIPAFTTQPGCEHVTFPTPFGTQANHLRVLVSLVHPASTVTHDPSAVWAQAVTPTGFEACVSEDSGFDGEHPRSRVDWIAFVDPDARALGFTSARQQLSGNGTPACASVNVPSGVSETYQIQTSLYGGAASANRGTAVWVENVSPTAFRLCAQLLENAAAPLANTSVDWAVYSPFISDEGFSAGEVDFESWNSGTQCETVATDCSGCENIQVSVNHRNRTEAEMALHGATLVWVEDFAADGQATVCVRETSAENGTHDAHLSVDWLARKQND